MCLGFQPSPFLSAEQKQHQEICDLRDYQLERYISSVFKVSKNKVKNRIGVEQNSTLGVVVLISSLEFYEKCNHNLLCCLLLGKNKQMTVAL